MCLCLLVCVAVCAVVTTADGVIEEEHAEEPDYTGEYHKPESEDPHHEQELGFEDGKFNFIL